MVLASAVKISAGVSRVTMQTPPPGLSGFMMVFVQANHRGNSQMRWEGSRLDKIEGFRLDVKIMMNFHLLPLECARFGFPRSNLP